MIFRYKTYLNDFYSHLKYILTSYFTCIINHFDISLSYPSQRGIKPNKFEEHDQHCYDVPHPSSSSFEYMRESSEIPQDQSLLIHEHDLHSYPSPSNNGTMKFQNKQPSFHVNKQRKRRKGGFSSFFMPDRNNSRRVQHSRSWSSRRNESLSNQHKWVSRSQSIDSIGHLRRTPPTLPRNGHNMRSNITEGGRRNSYKRRSFTGSLNSLLDGQCNRPALFRSTSPRRRTHQEDKTAPRNHKRSPHQSPHTRHRTRSNSRERSFASSLDSLFMSNNSHHKSPKNNRKSRKGDFFDENKHQFGKSQRSRPRSRSGSRTPPLMPRKGSLKKVNKENHTFIQGNRTSTRGNHLTRTNSVHFEDAANI